VTDFRVSYQKFNRGYLLVMYSHSVEVVCSNFMTKLSKILPNFFLIFFFMNYVGLINDSQFVTKYVTLDLEMCIPKSILFNKRYQPRFSCRVIGRKPFFPYKASATLTFDP
jgi:hypothetical protein